MKTTGFYQVVDHVGGCAITQLIPAQNRLTAALGFRNAYMEDPELKKQYNYKALELIEVAIADIMEDGLLYIHQSPSEPWSISGRNIIDFIKEEMAARGVDDFIVDDDKEE